MDREEAELKPNEPVALDDSRRGISADAARPNPER